MAVDNIDLSGEIKAWKDAAYGKDVRAANVAAFEKIQGTVNDTVQNVNQASKDASSASQNAQKAVDDIQSAIETATSKASEAAGSATAADTSKKAAASSAAAADNSKTQAAASAAEAKKIAQGLGDFDGTAAKVKTTDTYGLVVSALGESTAQALIDAIANKVVNELINKNKIVNNLLATDASTVLAGTQGAALDKRLVAAENAVAQLNSDTTAINNTVTSQRLVRNLSERNDNAGFQVRTTDNTFDANYLLANGVYGTPKTGLNLPFEGYWILLVFNASKLQPNHSSAWIFQLAISTDTNNKALYFRRNINYKESGWETWRTISAT